MTHIARSDSPPSALTPTREVGGRPPALDREASGVETPAPGVRSGEAPIPAREDEPAGPLRQQDGKVLFPRLPGGRRPVARVLRPIQSFVRDDRGLWVAQLECGHLVDVPPEAPPPAPEWSRTEHGRMNLRGSLLACPACLSASSEARPQGAVPDAEGAGRSWGSFWMRPKEPPSRMQPTWVDSKVACGSVRSVDDVERVARLGFRDVLSLDRAGEPDRALSPHFEASWVRALDMTHHWVPVNPARITEGDVDRFLEILRSLRGPVLVHSNGSRRAHALSTVWLGVLRGLDGPGAVRATGDLGLAVDERDREFVGEQLKRLLARDRPAPTAPPPSPDVPPPGATRGADREATRAAALPSARSGATLDRFEIIRWETDGGSVAEDDPPS